MGKRIVSSDLRRPTSREDVIIALKSERAYQLRRWGFRQEDGLMLEAEHDVYEWVTYIDDYLAEAKHFISRNEDRKAYDTALDCLRKCVTMAIAAFEMRDIDPYKQIYTGYVRPPQTPMVAGVEWYLLRIQGIINKYLQEMGSESTDSPMARDAVLQSVIDIGVVCFENYGISPRDLTQPITNGRDGQPA